jgi:LysM repeat protein
MTKKVLWLVTAGLLTIYTAVAVGQVGRQPTDYGRAPVQQENDTLAQGSTRLIQAELTVESAEATPVPELTPPEKAATVDEPAVETEIKEEVPVPRVSRTVADRSSAAPPPPAEKKPETKPVPAPAPEPAPPSVTYTTYTVTQGDTLWLISQKVGLPMTDLLKANNLTEATTLYVGMILNIPQVLVPEKITPGPQYGELVDWWTEAQYIWPIGQNAKVIDFRTGKSFMVRRSYGAFHADVEPLTAQDSAIMNGIWNGWSWATRPVIVEVNGRRLAASANGMPHDIQSITNNNFNGHFCIHFLNSTRHKDNLMQADHQQNVRTAAGQ